MPTMAGVARPDVIVVGAGPAGAATAILLCERGLDVLVLDRAAFPRPKLCGEYLSPESARILDRLGVLKRSTRPAPFRSPACASPRPTGPCWTRGIARAAIAPRIAVTPWPSFARRSTRSWSTACGRCRSLCAKA